jgi:hypothetical protein
MRYSKYLAALFIFLKVQTIFILFHNLVESLKLSMKNKKAKTMAEVSKGYENFISSKSINNNSRELFEKAITKAVKPTKQRGSK